MVTQAKLSNNQVSEKIKLNRLLWVAPLGMLVSSVANLGLYTAAGKLYPEVTAWAGASQGQIIGATIFYLFMAAITLAVINHFSRRPIRNYWIVATVGLVVSLMMPISLGMGYGPPEMPPVELATVVTLSLMHILSYIISVPLYTRLGLE